MIETDDLIDRMSRAARTSLFDTACDPELMIALVLSNLMSARLWDYGEKIAAKIDPAAEDREHAVMQEIARYVDSHFFHVTQSDVGEIWGLIEIDAEASGSRAHGVRHAIDLIMGHNAERLARGIDQERRDLAPYVERGVFPEYLYTNLDIVNANRRVLKRKKHKPYGITCCADEAILIASLACVLDGAAADDIVIIGSPEHYTTFISHQGETFWFNGKREFFDAETWAREVADNADGDPQAAFNARLKTFDQVITPQGIVHLDTRESTLDPARWRQVREDLAGFFGAELDQVGVAADGGLETASHPMAGATLAELDGARSPDEAAEILTRLAERYPGCAPEAAFYGYRDIAVRQPRAYVEAALREHRAREAAADVRHLDDAIQVVDAVTGSDPILGHPDRLALPDEVLLLDTGSDREKALLLYALLHHADAAPAPGELVLTDEDSYVRAGDDTISLRSLKPASEVVGTVVFRHE